MGYAVLAATRGGGVPTRVGADKPSLQWLSRKKREAEALGLQESPEQQQARQMLAESRAEARQIAGEERAEKRQMSAEERSFARQKELMDMREEDARERMSLSEAKKAAKDQAVRDLIGGGGENYLAIKGEMPATEGPPASVMRPSVSGARVKLDPELQAVVDAQPSKLTWAMTQQRIRDSKKESVAAAAAKKESEAADYKASIEASILGSGGLPLRPEVRDRMVQSAMDQKMTPTQVRSATEERFTVSAAKEKSAATANRDAQVTRVVEHAEGISNDPMKLRELAMRLQVASTASSETKDRRETAAKALAKILKRFPNALSTSRSPDDVMSLREQLARTKLEQERE